MLTSMKGEINSNTIIVGEFNTPLTPMDRSSRQKLNKETKALNNTLDQLDLIDIYRAFHPKIIHFTIYSSAHGTFSRRDHIKPWVIIKKLRSFQASFQITVLQY